MRKCTIRLNEKDEKFLSKAEKIFLKNFVSYIISVSNYRSNIKGKTNFHPFMYLPFQNSELHD